MVCPFRFQELITRFRFPERSRVHEEAQTAGYPQVPDPVADGDAALIFTNEWIKRLLFCKYLCPQGVLEGAIPLSLPARASNVGQPVFMEERGTGAVVLLSLLFYRPFCKWLCPLGAFYALFNQDR